MAKKGLKNGPTVRWTQNWYKFDYQVLYKKWTMLFTLYVFNWIIDQKFFFFKAIAAYNFVIQCI